MDHFKWHYLPTVRYTFHKSWESTWKIKHLLFLPYIVFASSTDLGIRGGGAILCQHLFFPNNQGFLLYNYRQTQNKISEKIFTIRIFNLALFIWTHTLNLSFLGVKPTICYIFPILQGILCLTIQQEVNWEKDFKCRQTFYFFKASELVLVYGYFCFLN